MKSRYLCILVASMLVFAGCGHKQPQAKVPQPPELPQPAAPPNTAETPTKPPPENPAVQSTKAELEKFAAAPALLTEVGIASWYGPPYHNRRGSNGEIYDMNAMTAAHRTLPLNSVVRVTNLKTGHAAVVRITDRGPFIGERMLDLSLAAAKAIDLWSAGTGWVKMELLESPVPVDRGGRWAVQIGAFNDASAAAKLKRDILSRYHPAKVLEFAGPTGEWVRIRVENDDRELAEEISRSCTTPEGGVFLVRLD